MIAAATLCFAVISCNTNSEKALSAIAMSGDSAEWKAPDETTIPKTPEGQLIKYGKELIVHTSRYLGPKGTVASLTNGMNCQNCHLNAGQQLYANSFSMVTSTYPKLSPRSGKPQSVEGRVNDCMERSLNGKKLDTAGKEMQAMVAYIKWVGSNVPQGSKQAGAGTQKLAFSERKADTAKGNILYRGKCMSCHGANGEGVLAADSSLYTYPPLWGKHSYNVSAGIFMLSKMAGFIKNNMPFGATYKKPQLTEEEAWDIAAFVNSQPRSNKTFGHDWPDISKKPADYPFAPYSDTFSETQHKFGPLKPIAATKR